MNTRVSAPVRSGDCSSSSAKTDGTVLTTSTARASPSARTRASRTRSTLPPVDSVVNNSNTDTSKLTEVLASIRHFAGAPSTVARWAMPLVTFPWVIATPFGVPVDPEVYITYAVLSGRAAALPSAGEGSVSTSRSAKYRRSIPVVGSTCSVTASVRTRCGRAWFRTYSRRPLG